MLDRREPGQGQLVRKDTSSADVQVLVKIFNELFAEDEATELVVGAEEPLYLPASKTGGLSQIISRLDYFSSALHEISHWCIAGAERRKLVDFGYWYEPDGRNEFQQREFEKVEVKPQALEWIMTEACGMRFRLSVDNTAQPDIGASERFALDVSEQARDYLQSGLPDRAERFVRALKLFFRPECEMLDRSSFSADKLI